jgi:hypothetical protein
MPIEGYSWKRVKKAEREIGSRKIWNGSNWQPKERRDSRSIHMLSGESFVGRKR